MSKLLVVEDNIANRELLVYVLSSASHEVDIARDGVEGLEALEKHSYDLALVDIFMPRMDGLEMIKKIRQSNPDILTRFVAVTASAMGDEPERLLKAGFDGYIAKPIDVMSFGKQIAPYLQG